MQSKRSSKNALNFLEKCSLAKISNISNSEIAQDKIIIIQLIKKENLFLGLKSLIKKKRTS